MNITALISIGQKMATAVPNDAIVSDQGKDYIFVQTQAKEEKHGHNEEKETAHTDKKEHEEEKADRQI